MKLTYMPLTSREFALVKGWYLKGWISYREYIRLTDLPF